jgi:hypothetical protein
MRLRLLAVAAVVAVSVPLLAPLHRPFSQGSAVVTTQPGLVNEPAASSPRTVPFPPLEHADYTNAPNTPQRPDSDHPAQNLGLHGGVGQLGH